MTSMRMPRLLRCEETVPKLAFQEMLSNALVLKIILSCREVFSKSQALSAQLVLLITQSLEKYVALPLDMCSATKLSHVLWCVLESGGQVVNRDGVFFRPAMWWLSIVGLCMIRCCIFRRCDVVVWCGTYVENT